ncbi:MAG TPA: alkane 1-monooxygenase [Gammaproteobacteria bacterium]|uniref:LLM class flavin-dependent oxidoreductase n=1 Tax=Immundisolibacter sp. TaxID=1934948 RepID=UPI000E7DF729|nr:alkane 1-monooxygenase [Gammaproteobacteria bacterium]HCZ48894.1 alkane 1-monooxygenase [Gammaproteobacteria bacterium]MCH78332.1 alkane 1-monooxygenase [Gammaproteobacteria bacterium]
MIPFSVLDLCPVFEGSSAADALRNSLDLAQHAEQLGYRRYWLAEHHGMPGIASAATAVVIAHIAQGTQRIRVGSGGIMLPNHAPLVIAEQFGTLESLFPGRIDLGLGRAPGTDQATAAALRRDLMTSAERFPQDVVELMRLLGHGPAPDAIQAVPGAGLRTPVWILGSSLFGAQLAAALGLPYAFASHFAPQALMQAIDVYRSQFRPSEQLDRPHLMLGFSVYAADDDATGELLASSMQQAFIALRTGRPDKIPAPVPGYLDQLPAAWRAMLEESMSCSAIGGPQRVREQIAAFIARTGADELMISSPIHDPAARRASYTIAAEVREQLAAAGG